MMNDNIKRITEGINDRYSDNLAGIILFGSYSTNDEKVGESDINIIVLLKKLGGLSGEEELRPGKMVKE